MSVTPKSSAIRLRSTSLLNTSLKISAIWLVKDRELYVLLLPFAFTTIVALVEYSGT